MVICDDVSVRDCCLDVLDVYETRILINFFSLYIYVYVSRVRRDGTRGLSSRIVHIEIQSIPVWDLSPWSSTRTGTVFEIRHACREMGFYYGRRGSE